MYFIKKDEKWLIESKNSLQQKVLSWGQDYLKAKIFVNFDEAKEFLNTKDGSFWSGAEIFGDQKQNYPRGYIGNNIIIGNGDSGITGIHVEGYFGNMCIEGNRMSDIGTGINVIDRDLDSDLIIEDNEMRGISRAGIVLKNNPYKHFGIPSEISSHDLYNLFLKLDSSGINNYQDIVEESTLSKIDQCTSIVERLINFSKEYGPILIATYGQYLNSVA
jgi:hypothetical protein